jgi:putative ABC transport system permease protein
MTIDRIRVAIRTALKQPVFASVVILSLGLAIALNTTMYAVLDALIHPRVDVRDPASVYRVQYYGDFQRHVSDAARDSVLRSAPSIESVAWFNGPSFASSRLLRTGDQFAEAPVAEIGREYFELMGPRLVAGRIFLRSDDDAETRPMVVGEALATRLFASPADALGGRVIADSVPYVVVGVISKYADFPRQRGGFANFASNPSGGWVLGKPPRGMFNRLVRVRDGVTRAMLERDLDLVAQRIAILAGEPPRSTAFRVGGTTPEMVQMQSLHVALVMAVLAVLLVACANVANMQLARGIGRGRELALRAALGANRTRLISHMLLESAVLAGGGLLLGLVLTYWFGIALRTAIPPAVERYIVEPAFSWRVLVFAVVATVACLVLVGLAPAIRVSAVDPNSMLKSGAGTGATRRNRRQYGYLVVVEVGLALALLCACGVSVQAALRTDSAIGRQGYDPRPLAVGYVASGMRRGEREPLPRLLARILDQVRSVDGVTAAGISVSASFDDDSVLLADSSGMRALAVPGIAYRKVSPAFLRTMGMPIIQGRDFRDGERDVAGVIIDEYTAKKYWPNANPVGALIKLGAHGSSAPFVRIVGVVGQYDEHGEIKPINMADQSGATLGAIFYLPSEHDTADWRAMSFPTYVVARTNGDASHLATAMRRAGVLHAQAMVDRLGLTAARAATGFMASLFVLFAGVALALGAFGIYGVVAHSVAERRRELGVRIALGATARDILHAVLRETVVIGLSGIAFGLFLVWAYMSPLQSFAYEGDIHNALLFAGIALFMFGVAALSAFIPARRATLVDPTESLRSE